MAGMLPCWGKALAPAKPWLQGPRLAPQHSPCSKVSLQSVLTQTGFFLPWLHLNSTMISPIHCYLAPVLMVMKGNASFSNPCLPKHPRAREEGTVPGMLRAPAAALGSAGAVSSQLSPGEQDTKGTLPCLQRAPAQLFSPPPPCPRRSVSL